MWYPFVRRLQRWWIKTQGNILDHKLTRAFNALAALDSERALAEDDAEAAATATEPIQAERCQGECSTTAAPGPWPSVA